MIKLNENNQLIKFSLSKKKNRNKNLKFSNIIDFTKFK